MMVRK